MIGCMPKEYLVIYNNEDHNVMIDGCFVKPACVSE
jgi:hypothetical protein